MLPPVAYSDNPSTSFAAKFVHSSLNKNRCSINCVLVYPLNCIILCLPCLSVELYGSLLLSLLIGLLFVVYSGHLQEDVLSLAPKVGSLLFGMGSLSISR